MTKSSDEIISVKADIVALDESLHVKFPNAKFDDYFITITLTNTQDTTVHIRIMTCSWSESFVFDKDSFYLSYPGCDINAPITLDIFPHKDVKFLGKLSCYKKDCKGAQPLSFKIGFVDLPYKHFFDTPYSQKDKMRYKIFWSDSLYLESKLYHYEEEKLIINR